MDPKQKTAGNSGQSIVDTASKYIEAQNKLNDQHSALK